MSSRRLFNQESSQIIYDTTKGVNLKKITPWYNMLRKRAEKKGKRLPYE